MPEPEYRYWLSIEMDDDDVEALAAGVATPRVQAHAQSMLRWKQDYYQSDAYAEELQRAETEIAWPGDPV